MEENFQTIGIDCKQNGRQIRHTLIAGAAAVQPYGKADDAGLERPLYLSRKEAMDLLALCAASLEPLDHGEADLFAKLGEYLRRF